MIATGAPAPDFELPDQDGEPVRLSALRGRTVVVYFYPKADTPGCTTQACSIRDRGDEYAAAGATVLGISPDPVKKVKKAMTPMVPPTMARAPEPRETSASSRRTSFL